MAKKRSRSRPERSKARKPARSDPEDDLDDDDADDEDTDDDDEGIDDELGDDEEYRIEAVEGRVRRVERELSKLRAAQKRLSKDLTRLAERPAAAADGGKAGRGDVSSAKLKRIEKERDEALVEAEEALEALAELKEGLEEAKLAGAGADSGRADELAAESDRLRQDNEDLRAQVKKLGESNESIDAELASLRVLYNDKVKRFEDAESGAADGEDLSDLPAAARKRVQEASNALRKSVVERDASVAELESLRTESAEGLAELEKKLSEVSSENSDLFKQRANLQRLLAQRDEEITSGGKELTVEDIAGSEVFKSMIGNIKQTCRLEITHMHDAVSRLEEIDPDAFHMVLDVVEHHFKSVKFENPLAKLGPTKSG